jgi:hypothetical protein
LAIDDQVVSINVTVERKSGKVASRPWFRKPLTPTNVTPQYLRQVELLEAFICAGNEGGSGVIDPHRTKPSLRSSGSRAFFIPNDLLKKGEAPSAIFNRPRDACPASRELRSLPLQIKVANFGTSSWPFPGSVFGEPGPDFLSKLRFFN